MILDAGTEAGFGDATTGNDLIQGTEDRDQIFGNTGNDLIYGNHGEDTIAGEEGFDTLYGGQGADVFQLVEGGNPDTITDFEAGVDSIQLPSGLTGEDVSLNEGTLSVNATGEVLAQVKGDVSTDDLLNDPAARLQDSVALAKQQLSEFANREDFAAQVQQNYGNVDVEAAQRLISDLIAGENAPNIEILSQEQLQGVSGGYDSVTGTVYLSQDLLATSDASQVADVMLEEWGHHLDAQLGNGDTPGDEGAEFSQRVLGESFTTSELDALRSEDDTVSVNINGQTVELEAADFWDNSGWRISYQWNFNSEEWEQVNQGSISRTRSDGSLGFQENWGRGSPTGVTNDDYFFSWNYIEDSFQAGETYEFNIEADDQASIWAWDRGSEEWTQISGWEEAYSGKQFSWDPQESGEYLIVVGHYESRGLAELDASWQQQGGSNGNEGGKQYFPELSSLSDDEWDRQSGDNDQFNGVFGQHLTQEEPAESGTRQEIQQIYEDLESDLFAGQNIPENQIGMSAGYMHDESYTNVPGVEPWHAGIDIDVSPGQEGSNGATVKAVAPGKVAWVINSGTNGEWVGITSESGQHRWVYGHLTGIELQTGESIEKGGSIGNVHPGPGHVHLETRTQFESTGGAESSKQEVDEKTRSPLQTYWLSRA